MSDKRRAQQRHFESRLVEYHQALIEGRSTGLEVDTSDTESGRLHGAQICIEKLHAMWRHNEPRAGADSVASAAPAAGDSAAHTIGRFRIERELGSGGAG